MGNPHTDPCPRKFKGSPVAASDDVEFMRNKIAIARFYAEHVLTRVPGLRDSVVDGAGAINEVAVEAF